MNEDLSTSRFGIYAPHQALSSDFTDIEMVPSAGYNLLAKAKRNGRWWMLKGLKPEYREVKVYQEALHKEYDVLSHLHHPSVVSVESIEEVPDLGTCLVMEYVEGSNLRDALKQGMTLSARKKVAHELIEVVKFIHRNQIAHRDLKPSNIMLVAETGYLKLIDFGLSDGSCYDYLKQPSGTDRYMSEEQKQMSDPDVRNDIYSMGCILEDLDLGHRYSKLITNCRLPINQRYQTADLLQEAMCRAEHPSRLRWIVPLVAIFTVLILLGIRYHWTDAVYRLSQSIHLTEYHFCEDGIYYNVLSDDSLTVEVTHNGGTNAYRGDITIPEYVEHSGRRYKVVRVGDDAFRLTTDLDAVVLPQTLRSVGNNAFMQSEKVATLFFPDSIVEMGDSVIRNCTYIRSVRLPLSYKSVPRYCFSGCWKLRDVSLHEGITTLERDALAGTAISAITFPKSLRVIERGVFWGCYRLQSINIPAGVERIGDFAFWHCDSLRHIYVERPEPLHITNIFQNLKDVTLHVPKGSAEAYRKAEGWNELNVVED